MRAGEVLIVSGPPGSGKTTVSRVLANEAELGVHLEADWFFRAISGGFIAPHRKDAHAQNLAVIDVIVDAAAGYASAGYLVVWDGIVGPWFLDRVAQRLASRGIRLRYVVLRPPREVALQRVSDRDGTTELSGAETMYDQFDDLGPFEANVIHVGDDVSLVAERCRAAAVDDAFVVDREGWVDDRWPVSVKGVLLFGDRVVVLKNDREEWELPGGRLDTSDAGPIDALRREMREELDLDVEVGPLLDSWIYDVQAKRVLIMTYLCGAPEPSELTHSNEHTEVAAMTRSQLESAPIPAGYLRSIDAAQR